MFKEFKEFLMKGNVLDLAVAVIIGAAFGAIVMAINKEVLMPLVQAMMGEADFSKLSFAVGDARINWGKVLQATIDFVVTGLVLFMVVKAYNSSKKKEAPAEEAPAGPSETDLLVEIRDLLKK